MDFFLLFSIDTESIYTKIFCSFLKEYGKEFTMEFKVKLMGKPELVSLQAVLEEYQLTNILTVQQAQAILKERKLELFPHAQLLPGLYFLFFFFFFFCYYLQYYCCCCSGCCCHSAVVDDDKKASHFLTCVFRSSL